LLTSSSGFVYSCFIHAFIHALEEHDLSFFSFEWILFRMDTFQKRIVICDFIQNLRQAMFSFTLVISICFTFSDYNSDIY